MEKNKKLKKSPMNSDIHFKLLDILEKNPELSQRLLSRELGISLGSINYCIRALVEKGQVSKVFEHRIGETIIISQHHKNKPLAVYIVEHEAKKNKKILIQTDEEMNTSLGIFLI